MAIRSFVPTPSVAETNIGSTKPAPFKSNKAPKPPNPEATPDLVVFFTAGLIFSMSLFPASISTPAPA